MAKSQSLDLIKNEIIEEVIANIKGNVIEWYSEEHSERTLPYIAGMIDCLTIVKKTINKHIKEENK